MEGIANLLDIKGESVFRIRAYREAARHVEGMLEDIDRLHAEQRLQEIPGVGASIAAKIDEYLRTDHIAAYEELKGQVAPGLGRLLDLPGLGPRRAKIIHQHLGITSFEELEKAAQEHRLCHLPGIKEITEQKILREVSRFQQRTRRVLLGTALPVAEQVVAMLRGAPAVEQADMAGSVRRKRDTIGDIDVLAASTRPAEVMEHFATLPIVKEVLLKGLTKCSILTHGNLQVDLRVLRPEEYGAGLLYFTGSKEHNIVMRDLAIGKGLKLSEYGLFENKTGRRLAGATEQEVYAVFGMAWIPPELRECGGEIEAAMRRRLPALIVEGDIRGDLHVHTDWTDGVDRLEVMVAAARERGYEYVAITDHSMGLGVARGLKAEKVREQQALIEELNVRFAPFRILHGTEVEIRRDGSLDYPEEILAELDFVTASVHSAFEQPREQMTERIVKAMHSPYVDIIGHPRGRLIGKREGYQVDIEALIRAAVATGTALEINSQPDRLDLDYVWARRAKDNGAMLAIDSDAHSRETLAFMRLGVATARRGWVEKKDVLNALPLEELLAKRKARVGGRAREAGGK